MKGVFQRAAMIAMSAALVAGVSVTAASSASAAPVVQAPGCPPGWTNFGLSAACHIVKAAKGAESAVTQGAVPPTPGTPGRGTGGMLDPTPAPGNGLYSKYGYSPLSWATYNLPKLTTNPGKLSSDTGATLDTSTGAAMFGAAVDIVALGNGLTRLVSPPTFLRSFDKLITTGTHALYNGVFNRWVEIALGIVALGIIIDAVRRGNFAQAYHSAGWALFVLGLVTYINIAPVTVATSATGLVTSTVNSAYAALDGSGQSTAGAAGNLEMDEVLYPMWLQGEFGSSSSPAAKKYGRALFDANGYTWAETDGGTKAPSTSVMAGKKAEWNATVTAIQKMDPAAYQTITGQGSSRTGAGFVAMIAAALTTFFRIVSAILIVASLLMLLLGVIVSPVVCAIALNSRLSFVLKSLADKIVSALISAVVFAILASLNILMVGVLLSPASGLALPFGVLFSGVGSAALWIFAKPYRKLTAIAGVVGAKAGKRYGKHRAEQRRDSRAASRTAEALGGLVGGAAGAALVEHHIERDRDEARPAPEVTPDVEPDEVEAPAVVEPERVEAEPAPEVVEEPEREDVVA